MAVPEQTPFIEYIANGSTTNFALDFDCDKQDYLIVTLDDNEPPVGSWSLSAGFVVFLNAPSNGVKVEIKRNTPFERTVDYQSYNNSFRPPVVNKDFDLIWWKLQELGVADWTLNNGLKQEILDRIAADEQMLDYILNQGNALKSDYIARDANLKSYIDQMIALVTGDPSFRGIEADFVLYGGKNQKQINDAFMGKRWFAPLYGVRADSVTDDSAALNAIISQMQIGDILEVLPRKHKINSPIIVDKAILITSLSCRHQTLGALFECDSHGVVFKSPWVMWDGISLVGKYTKTVLDPSDKVFGSIGMKHEYSADGTSSGVVVRDCFVTYFDTNVVESQEVGQAWAGAYREYYNVFLRYGRINLAMIDGATLSNWHGGAIQLGVERGIHLDCPNMQYNNLVLHGTALEKNGFIAGLFPTNEQKTYGLYAGKNSKILIHGGYSEAQSCFAKDGGRIEFYGSHQHLNSKLFAKNDGVILNYGGFGSISSRLSIDENYATFLNTSAANTQIAQVSSVNKSCRVTSSTNTTISLQSRGVSLSQLKTDNLGGVKLSVKYNISSGFTANPNIIITPSIRLTSGSNSDAVIQNLTYPNFELKNEVNKDATFEFYLKPRIGASYLPSGADLTGLYIVFSIQNVDGTACDFSSDNLNFVIKNIEVEAYANAAFDFFSELPKSGTTANRPTKLGAYERGFTYYDTTEARNYLWNGTAWVKQKSVGDDLFGSYSTAQLSDATNSVNTLYKQTSNFVLNNTNGKMYYRTGTSANSVWRATDGSGDITPV